MDQEVVFKALEKHIEVIEKTLLSVIGLAFVVGWAGYNEKNQEIQILGITADRGQTYFFALIAFFLANFALWMLFLRVRDLLKMVDAKFLTGAFDVLRVCPSLFNPFARFGEAPAARFHSSLGIGTYIFTWWMCAIALATLSPKSYISLVAAILLVPVGLAGVFAARGVHSEVFPRMQPYDAGYASELRVMLKWRTRIGLIAFAIGATLWVLTLVRSFQSGTGAVPRLPRQPSTLSVSSHVASREQQGDSREVRLPRAARRASPQLVAEASE